MDKTAFDKAVDLMKKRNICFETSKCIDVGGSTRVCLRLPNRAGGKRRFLRDIILKMFGEEPPFENDIVFARNPILNLFKNVTLLDDGFNKGKYDADMDIQCDFLDPKSIEPLSEKFDVVVSFDTIEHIKNPFLFCQHLVKCVKKGGLIWVSTPFSQGYHPSPFDYFRFSPDGLKECFSDTATEILSLDWAEKEKTSYIMLRKM